MADRNTSIDSSLQQQQHHQQQQQQRGGKKVEFATNLTSFESHSLAHNGADRHVWDSETDHILSYFLDGDTQVLHGGIPEFANPEPLLVGANPAEPQSTALEVDENYFVGMEDRGFVGLSINSENFEEEDEPMAPPTPKLPQFSSRPVYQRDGADSSIHGPNGSFGAHSGFAANGAHGGIGGNMDFLSALPSSASSSSSCLSSMANTLVSGGPMLVHQNQQPMFGTMMTLAQQQQPLQKPFGPAAESPISPAANIGTPENLLLPPPLPTHAQASHGMELPTIYQNAAAAEAAGKSNPLLSRNFAGHPALSPASQQQHIAWLQSINAMAKAGQGTREALPTMLEPTMIIPPPPTHSSNQFGITFTAFPHMTFYGHAAAAAAAAMQQSKNPVPEESEEKRAKRLERNRESARKSRRRKKERLVAVEAQAAKFHHKIAIERERQIEKLVPGLRKCRIQQLSRYTEGGSVPEAAAVMTLVRETGPNSPVFQSVLEFQFNYLPSLIFPRYQRFWLWLALQGEPFFSAGKEEYIKREPDRVVVRTSSGKISSKQVGDELTNGPQQGSDANKRQASRSTKQGDDISKTCNADDPARMWPLFCYEHQFSVDQEDKFLNLHKKLGQKHDVKACWIKSQGAVKATYSLRDAMEFVCKVASNREERTLVGVLRADQILKYRQWIVMNHERCSRSLRTYHRQQLTHSNQENSLATTVEGPPIKTAITASPITTAQMDTSSDSLEETCLRLEQVLRISKTDKSQLFGRADSL